VKIFIRNLHAYLGDHQGKQATLQWLQDPSEISGVNLNNIRRETERHFRNEKREYLKDKIATQNQIET
jgi:hypothetical protein